MKFLNEIIEIDQTETQTLDINEQKLNFPKYRQAYLRWSGTNFNISRFLATVPVLIFTDL